MVDVTEREARLIELLRKRTDLGQLTMTRRPDGDYVANHLPHGAKNDQDGFRTEIDPDPVEALIYALGPGRFELEDELDQAVTRRTPKHLRPTAEPKVVDEIEDLLG